MRPLFECDALGPFFKEAPMKYFGGTPIAYFAVFGMKDLLEELVGDPKKVDEARVKAGELKWRDHVEEQARAKSARAHEKLKSNELKKVSLNLNKFLSGLQKLKSEIKDEKLPPFMKEDNALAKLINEGKELQDMMAAGPSDNEQVMRNKVVQFGTMSIDSELAIMNVCSVLDLSRVDSEFALMQVYRQFAIMNV